MRMWNLGGSFLLLCAMTLGLGACGDNGSGSSTASTAVSTSAASGKPRAVVGFSQTGGESDWRTANTKSIQDEALKRNIKLNFSDAQGNPENQISAIRNFISKKVDIIMLSPKVETGFESVLKEAKDAGIPVIMEDRRADVPEDYYAAFIGSDFVEEGRRAAEWLGKKMNGEGNIAQITGSPGSAPANDRKKGFDEVIAAKFPKMKIIKEQTGDFDQSKGKEVMEAFLKSPDGKQINAVFAHNDDMALGAIQAIEAAGLKPGKDIIIVSIDSIRAGLQAIVDGKLNCSVECNPILGPSLFDIAEKILAKEPIANKRMASPESVFDSTNAKQALPTRQY